MKDLRAWIDGTAIKVIKNIKLNIQYKSLVLSGVMQELVEPTRNRTDSIQGFLTPVLQWADKESAKMSLPDEKSRALKNTKDWMSQLKDKSYKPNTGEVREKAHRLLRHYPWSYDIEKGFPPNERDGVRRTSVWLRKLLDRKVKIRLGSLREQAADLLVSCPNDDMIDEAMKKWR